MVRRMFALALALVLAGCESGSYVIDGEASFSGAVEAYPGEWSLVLDGGEIGLSFATVTPPATATATVTPGPSPTPGPEWWLAGGIAPAACVGAYRGAGAASLAASQVNQCDPGTHDLAVGIVNTSGGPQNTPPDWSAALGWQGGQDKYWRLPGVMPTDEWTVVMEVRNAAPYSQQFAGAMAALGAQPGYSLNNTGAFQAMKNMGLASVAGVIVDGTTGIAGKTVYRNGAAMSPLIEAGTGTAPVEWFWLTANWGGVPHGGGPVTEVRAMALYSTTLTAAQMAALDAAMGDL